MWTSRREEYEEKNAALERELARLRDAGPEKDKGPESRDELDDLAVKWRGAAQKAADELFEMSRSRVERYGNTAPGHMRRALTGLSMGGMKELAAMRRRQAEFFNEEMGQGALGRPGSDEGSELEELEKEEVDDEKEDEVSYMAVPSAACIDRWAGIYHGHDASESKHRAGCHRLRCDGGVLEVTCTPS